MEKSKTPKSYLLAIIVREGGNLNIAVEVN